jgi:hypothetical protein
MNHGLKTGGASLSAPSSPRKKVMSRWRRCNLCADEFRPRTAFDRYCLNCKEESELLKFSEWLPELDAALTEQMSA